MKPAKSQPLLLPHEIFAPLPAVPRLVGDLGFYRGAVTLLAGAGYSGKTLTLQALMLAAAAGRPAWGMQCERPLRVLHVDCEQGEYLTRLRYQRLGRASAIGSEHLGDRLVLTTEAPVLLSKPGASATWLRVLEGFDMVLVDSLHAVTGGLEENDARARAPIDALNEIALKNGQSIVLVHHTRKDASSASAQEAIRGSSAIFDAPTSVYMLSRDKCGSRLVQHKDRYRQPTGAIVFEIVDVEDDGLRVLATAEEEREKQSSADDLDAAIVEFLATKGPQTSVKAIQKGVRRKREQVGAALRALLESGVVTKKEDVYELSEVAKSSMTQPND